MFIYLHKIGAGLSLKFICSVCNLEFEHKSKYNRHIKTAKHKQFALIFEDETIDDEQNTYSTDDDDKSSVSIV